jgi:uncharacterized protein
MIATWTDIPMDFWNVLGDMAPYLLLGFAIAGAMSVVLSPEFVERHLGGRGLGSILKASAFGVPLPLCSCGVIPVAASLRRHGASKAATVGFLISTPQTGVDSMFVTFSLLGGVFAVFRPLAALISGVLGGALVSFGDSDGAAEESTPPAPCQDACCVSGGKTRLRRALEHGFIALPRDVARPLLLGLVVAAVISAAVPKDYFGQHLGGGLLAMLAMMAIGIPIYVCSTASVPIAWALISAGVSPGAALVFLMTGPATNAATITTLWRVLGRRATILYLVSVAGSALGSGLLLDYVFTAVHLSPEPAMGWMLPDAVKWGSAIALLALLAYAAIRGESHEHSHDHEEDAPKAGEHAVRLSITGMTCEHCAGAVRKALLGCAGVQSANVNHRGGSATVVGDEGFDSARLAEAVRQAGYNVAGEPVTAADEPV